MIKATIDTKTLYQNVKLLKGIATAEHGKIEYKGRLGFLVNADGFFLVAGPGPVYMCVQIPAEYQGEGFCYVDYTILSILKIAKGERISLTIDDHVHLKDERGLKAKVNGINLPNVYDIVSKVAFHHDSVEVEVNAEDLSDIAQASSSFAEVGGWRWVGVKIEDGNLNINTQMSETGGIEAYSLAECDDSMEYVRLNPANLLSFLSFVGKRCKIHLPRTMQGVAVTITDPDNPAWWGIMMRLV